MRAAAAVVLLLLPFTASAQHVAGAEQVRFFSRDESQLFGCWMPAARRGPGQGVTVGSNPAARRDAHAAVFDFLECELR